MKLFTLSVRKRFYLLASISVLALGVAGLVFQISLFDVRADSVQRMQSRYSTM